MFNEEQLGEPLFGAEGLLLQSAREEVTDIRREDDDERRYALIVVSE